MLCGRVLVTATTWARAMSTTSEWAVQRIAIVGGTHGNEYTGVFVVRRLEAELKPSFEGLEVSTFIANVEAHAANRRFIDEDLNRQFSLASLERGGTTVEARRAREIDELIGPKKAPGFDLVVDLHTTTANMGTTIICEAWDPWALRAAAALVAKDSTRKILYNDVDSRDESPYLASLGKHALEIECGPTPQGVLRHDVVEATERAVLDVLDYCRNPNEIDLPETVEVYTTQGSQDKLQWPVDDRGFPTAIVHKSLQDKDYLPLRPGDPVFVALDGTVITYEGRDVVYPIFINEGGYYYAQSGRGLGLARKISLPLPPGGSR